MKKKQRETLIWAAAKLFRRRGYIGTGLRDILAASGAARGSFYHYFPEGKEEIGAIAVSAAGGVVTDLFLALLKTSKSPLDFLDLYSKMLVRWLEASRFRDGCPITMTLLETNSTSSLINNAGRRVFNDWIKIMEEMLAEYGWPAERIPATATTIIASLEGGLIMAQIQGRAQPIRDVVWSLSSMLTNKTEKSQKVQN